MGAKRPDNTSKKVFQMNTIKTFRTAAVVSLLTVSAAVDALTINFDYSYDTAGFFNDPTRKNLLQTAGNYFGNLITDNLTAINSAGVNSFNAVFSNPADGSTATIENFSVAADTLTIFAGGRALSGSTLGIGGPGGFSVSGTSQFVNNAVSRGQTGDTQGATATDIAPWGGSIVFNSGANWYFDSNPATTEPFSGNDFFSVALHELGHVFGLGTSDSWSNLIDANGNFTGSASMQAYGGAVPLSGTGHWASSVNGLVNGQSQQAAMSPSIVTGTRKVFTNIDVAGLQDVGWQVSAVPVPAAVWLFGSGIIALFGAARRKAA